MARRLLLTLLLLLGVSTAARAELLLGQQDTHVHADPQLRWLTTDSLASPTQVLERLSAGLGHQSKQEFLSFGLSRQVYWLWLPIDNQSGQAQWLLETGRPHIDRVDVYQYNSNQVETGHWWSGSSRMLKDRPFNSGRLIFPLSLTPSSNYLLIRAQSNQVMDLPISLYTPAAFQQSSAHAAWLNGLFFGAVIAFCLYNLLLFFSTRDRSYLNYVLYIGFFGLFLAARAGLGIAWLWPSATDFNPLSMTITAYLLISFSVLFVRDFLQLSRYLPNISRLFLIIAIASAVGACLTPFYPLLMTQLNNIPTLGWPVIAAAVGITVLRKGYRPAIYFLSASAVLILAAILYSLKSLQVLPNSWLLENSLQLALLVEALLLSFALAHRMTIIKRENERMQQQAQQELELKVRERTRELNAALNARSQFLAVMSHEIRTPLNGILGTLDLLKSSTLNNQQQQQLSVIENSGNSLLQLIDDILDYTRIEAGKMPLNEDIFSIANLAQECAVLFDPKAILNGNQLSVEVDDSIGDHVRGDALRVRQLLVNLISNAIKFTEGGQVTLAIKRQSGNPDYVYFSVTDTGIGIAEDKLALLFDLFQQADNSTSRQYGGTGLGLAVCQQLVEIMGGEIGVNSKLGQGSSFWFHLPLPKANTLAAEPPATVETTRSARLLIVDDNSINLMVAEGLCKKLGHEVETCISGSEAIATLLNDEAPFDAVLMDCEMPIMDGFATTREIIRLQKEGRIRNIPILALTAHAVPDKIRACHEAGMVLHIAKPINLEKLHVCLGQVLHD